MPSDAAGTLRDAQKGLAAALGISQQAVSKLESGRITIAVDTLWAIATLLNTNIDFYLEGLPTASPTSTAMGMLDKDRRA